MLAALASAARGGRNSAATTRVSDRNDSSSAVTRENSRPPTSNSQGTDRVASAEPEPLEPLEPFRPWEPKPPSILIGCDRPSGRARSAQCVTPDPADPRPHA